MPTGVSLGNFFIFTFLEVRWSTAAGSKNTKFSVNVSPNISLFSSFFTAFYLVANQSHISVSKITTLRCDMTQYMFLCCPYIIQSLVIENEGRRGVSRCFHIEIHFHFCFNTMSIRSPLKQKWKWKDIMQTASSCRYALMRRLTERIHTSFYLSIVHLLITVFVSYNLLNYKIIYHRFIDFHHCCSCSSIFIYYHVFGTTTVAFPPANKNAQPLKGSLKYLNRRPQEL